MFTKAGKRQEAMQVVQRLLTLMTLIVSATVALFTVYMILASDNLAAYVTDLHESSEEAQMAARAAHVELLRVRQECLDYLGNPRLSTGSQLLAQADVLQLWPEGEAAQDARPRLEALTAEAAQSIDRIVELGLAGRTSQARSEYQQVTAPLFDEADVLLSGMISAENARTREYLQMAADVNGRINVTSVVFAVAVIAVTVLVSLYANRAIQAASDGAYERDKIFGLIADNVDEVFEVYSIREHQLVYVSGNLHQLFGVPTRAYRENPDIMRSSIPEEDLEKLEAIYFDENVDGPQHCEFRYHNASTGKEHVFHSVLYPVQNALDEPTMHVLLTRDVTEEAHMRSALEDALKQAEAANEAKQEFLSNMSHEVRTPINAIIGMEALAKSALDDPLRVNHYLQQIGASGRHLLSLVNDILDMSKIENERLELEAEPINLEATVADLVMMVTSRVDQKRQTLTVKMRHCSVRNVIGDELRLRQVLLNLLSNAIKYTQEGGSITLKVSQKPARSGIVDTTFSVADNGSGISREDRERIFLPFERAARASGQPGTGLGLSISRHLVAGMGGSLEVESVLDQGSTFSFTIPMAVDEAAQEAAAGETGGKLLLVEDNIINMEIARELLQSAGYEVVEAVNGREGVEIFGAAPPGTFAAVLMDIQMPVMDGFEAAARMRADPARLGRTPILALTANVFSTDQEGRDLFDDFIAKPINPAQMFAQIEAARKVGSNRLPGSKDGQSDQTIPE